MNTQISEKKLKSLIKESVKEVFESELTRFKALAMPEVSDKEQKDIEERYGEPSQKTSSEKKFEI